MKSDISKDSIIKKKAIPAGKSDLPAWIPETDFSKSDFPVQNGSGKKTASASSDRKPGHVKKTDTPPSQPVKVSGWKPPVLSPSSIKNKSQDTKPAKSARSDISHKTDPVQRDHRVHSAPGRTQGGSSQTKSSSDADATLDYFKSMIMNFPENTVYLLRNWYFKKHQPSGQGIDSIHPHDRIFIVLASAGPEITKRLFGIMSPVERQNFSEILRGRNSFNSHQIQTVRSEFMYSVRDFV